MKNCMFLGALFFLFFFSRCCSEGKNIIEINQRKINPDTIQFSSINESSSKIAERLNNLIGFDSLKKAGDWLEIRIIRYRLSSTPVRICVLKRRAGKWSGYIVSIRQEFNKTNDNLFRYLPEMYSNLPPKSSWNSFGQQLLDSGILEIGKTIPLDGGSSTDMEGVTVEYASKDEYREYSVYDPEVQKSEGGIKMYHIIQLIEKELEFKNFASLSTK